MIKKFKVDDKVKTTSGFTGTVVEVQFRGASGSTCSYVSSLLILLENGMLLESLPELVTVLEKK